MSSNQVLKTTFLGKDALTPVVKGINTSMENFKRSAQGGFGLAAGVKSFDFAVQAFYMLGDVVKQGITDASNLEQAYGKVNAVFGDAGESIVKFSKMSATALGISQRQTLEYSGTLGNLMKATGVTSDAAAQMSLNLVKLAGDVAAFNNVSPERVLTAFSAALVGEAEPARRLGAFISAMRVDNALLAEGFAKTKSEITDSMRVYMRYKILLQDTADQQGQVAREADNFATQLQKAQSIMEDFSATIGQVALLTLTPIIQDINLLATALRDFGTIVEGAPVQGALDFLTTLFNVATNPFATLQTGMMPFIEIYRQYIELRNRYEATITDDEIAEGIKGIGDAAGGATNELAGFAAVKFPVSFTDFKPSSIFDALNEQMDQFKQDIRFLAENPNYADKISRQFLRLTSSPAFQRIKAQGGVIGDALVGNIENWGRQQLGTGTADIPLHLIQIGKRLGRRMGMEGSGPFMAAILAEALTPEEPPVIVMQGKIIVKEDDVVLPAFVPVRPTTGIVLSTDSSRSEDTGEGGPRAFGGAMNPYKRYLVGERGPEWLIMGSQGGRLMPNGGGGDVVVNVDGEQLFRIMNKRMGRALAMGV